MKHFITFQGTNIIGLSTLDDDVEPAPSSDLHEIDQATYDAISQNPDSHFFVDGQVTVDNALALNKRRQAISDEYDTKIAAQREKIRQLQDEDKASLVITNAKTVLKSLITEKNTKLGAIV